MTFHKVGSEKRYIDERKNKLVEVDTQVLGILWNVFMTGPFEKKLWLCSNIMMISYQNYLFNMSPVFNIPMIKLPMVMQFTRKLSRLFIWGCSFLSFNGFWAFSCASSFLFWMKIGMVKAACTKRATKGIKEWRLWFVGKSFHFWSK